jgi:hypothetical protein
MENATIGLFTKLNIDISNNSLDNILIEREKLLSKQIYDSLGEEIYKMRKLMRSSYFTSMQKTAEKSQRWPLINLLRQVLKVQGFKMKPVRKAYGYKNGIKIYRRFFLICKTQ